MLSRDKNLTPPAGAGKSCKHCTLNKSAMNKEETIHVVYLSFL